jgi:hypothetical protein
LPSAAVPNLSRSRRSSTSFQPPRYSSAVEAELNIAQIESMDAHEIDLKLRVAGIDPHRTIEAVTKLVAERLQKHSRR